LVVTQTFISFDGQGSATMTVANGGLISAPLLLLTGPNVTINLESGGTLQLTSGQGFGLDSGNLDLNLSGGTLQSATSDLDISVNGTMADNTTTFIDTDGNSTTYSGVLNGNGSLAVKGGGELTLNATNTYLGATNIVAGTLALAGAGSIATSSAINLAGGNLDVSALNVGGTFTIGASQALAGSGTVISSTTGNLAINGTLAPGVAGPLTVSGGNVALNGIANFTLNDPAHYSQLSAASSLTYGGNLSLNLGSALFNGIYNLFSFGSQSGDFLGVNLVGLFTGALADSAGVWTGTQSTEDFSFNDATGQLTVSDSFPPGTSATKQAWLQSNFSIAQLANTAVSGDNASPAGDDIPNFFKYAFNLSALTYGRAGLPQPTIMNGNLVLSFTTQPGITYTVEASTDLVTWSAAGVTQQANGSQVTATYPLPPSGTAFLHVVVGPSP
jgi:autotransporter-associated beta strand protein